MIARILESLSTSAYSDPTLLLANVLGKYDLPIEPAYSGNTVEIYASSDRHTEIVVNWSDETIDIYGVSR